MPMKPQGSTTPDVIPPDKGIGGKGTPALRATPAPPKTKQPEASSESPDTATKQ